MTLTDFCTILSEVYQCSVLHLESKSKFFKTNLLNFMQGLITKLPSESSKFLNSTQFFYDLLPCMADDNSLRESPASPVVSVESIKADLCQFPKSYIDVFAPAPEIKNLLGLCFEYQNLREYEKATECLEKAKIVCKKPAYANFLRILPHEELITDILWKDFLLIFNF